MKRVLLAVMLIVFGAGICSADPTNLSNGVLIAHHDPAIVWSDFPPAEGWCQRYLNNYAISNCADQNPSILTEGNKIWYVLAQWWDEPKTWCLTEFGFGAYDANLFLFLASGPCVPSQNLEISTGSWPGPNSGTAVTTTDVPWNGNFLPVYYFTGYAYYAAPGVIPFAPDPTQIPFAGFINCLTPPVAYSAICLPSMGILMPGIECCSAPPAESPCCFADETCRVMTEAACQDAGGTWHPEYVDCGPPNPCEVPHVCCVGEVCHIATQFQCTELAGEWHPEWDSCQPNPCELVRAVCCLNGDCSITTQAECTDAQGEWHPEWTSCEPENPCPPTPAERTTWGTIKSIYR